MKTPASHGGAAHPMDFGFRDLARGAVTAWTVFMAILIGALVLLSLAGGDPGGAVLLLGYGAVVGGAISLAVMLAGCPLAWLLGRALVRVRAVGLHALAFTALGAATGFGVVLLYVASTDVLLPDALTSAWSWTVVIVSAISVLGGWAHAMRHAHRARTRVRALRRPAVLDEDAAYEDGASGL
ncbi:hypothetical protein ACFWHT_07940 [Microbacterium sp. NPDC058342]|uniref:hypothetical protein n=1 Tax=Microbacterium sp. NPDC058342 TaxID=3346454 RepID=UPI003657A5EE